VCGIAGVVRSAGIDVEDRQCVRRMETLLRHRGPDDAGRYDDRYCTLAQTRLALIGPATLPIPAASPDGRYTLVYNGEIYNFPDLRRELESETPFALPSDTEVVLAAWIRWGSGALTRFNGMFAFFIWDAVERRGFAACDALGIKPFFYHHAGGRFAFASEAGALVESGAARFAPDDEAIAESLVAPYFSSVTRLPLAGIERLKPGHWLEVRNDRSTVTQYFHFEHQRAAVPDVEAFIDEMAECVESAAVASLRADAAIGVFLSGGVVSSLLTALAQRHTATPLPAWTIAYAGEQSVDYSQSLIIRSADRPFAEQVAGCHGCNHVIVDVDEHRYEAALLQTLRTNDLICAWEQEVSQYLLAQAASSRVKAVLVGDAADETHFGYSFLLHPDRIPSPQRIIEFFGAAPLRREFLDDPAAYFTCKYRKFAEDRGYRWDTWSEQRLAMSCLIYHLWLTRLLHNGDIHLMAQSLEGRVPFGDIHLLALARRLPQELGYRDGVEKWHLRRAAERFLEPAVAWRPKSALTKNLRAHRTIHRHFARAWRRSGAFLEPYVDRDAVERLADGGPAGAEKETGICFRLLAVMSWFERFNGVSV
jgi:asparagine synthase (glutamine-hydrolysing)